MKWMSPLFIFVINHFGIAPLNSLMLEHRGGLMQPINPLKTVSKVGDLSSMIAMTALYYTPLFNEVDRGVYWYHLVRLSVCLSVRLWTESCPLCIFNNTHRIHFIFVFFWLGIQYDSMVWVIMRRRGVSSERRRSSCSSFGALSQVCAIVIGQECDLLWPDWLNWWMCPWVPEFEIQIFLTPWNPGTDREVWCNRVVSIYFVRKLLKQDLWLKNDWLLTHWPLGDLNKIFDE